MRCKGITKKGTICKFNAKYEGYCAKHCVEPCAKPCAKDILKKKKETEIISSGKGGSDDKFVNWGLFKTSVFREESLKLLEKRYPDDICVYGSTLYVKKDGNYVRPHLGKARAGRVKFNVDTFKKWFSKCKKDLVILPLSREIFDAEKTSLHANVIIIDKKYKCINIYDSHGGRNYHRRHSRDKKSTYYRKQDDMLEELFKQNFREYHFFRSDDINDPETLSFGIQHILLMQKDKHLKGTCSVLSTFFAEMRIHLNEHPNVVMSRIFSYFVDLPKTPKDSEKRGECLAKAVYYKDKGCRGWKKHLEKEAEKLARFIRIYVKRLLKHMKYEVTRTYEGSKEVFHIDINGRKIVQRRE